MRKGVLAKLINKVLEMSEATNRQRRNLLLTTVTLILICHAGMVFGEELKLLGTSVKITNPDILIKLLIIGHIYFSWRFYQYFYMDKAYSDLRSQYKDALEKKLDQVLMAYIFSSLPKGVTTISGDFKYSEVSRTDDSGGCYEVRVDYPSGSKGEQLSEMVSIPIKIFRFKGIAIALRFIFRGKILTDYYLPFFLATYALICNLL